MHASPNCPARRTLSTPASRSARVRLTLTMVALLGASVAACSDDDPTGIDPEVVDPVVSEVPTPVLVTSESSAGQSDALSATLTTDTTFYVSPAGSDANPGTQAQPFKTLAKALSISKAGNVIRLASGLYSKVATGERYTSGSQEVLVPAGVTIIGALDGTLRTSVLQGGSNETGLKLKGSATVKNLDLRGFQIAVEAVKGAQVLSNLLVSESFFGLSMSDSARTTLNGSTVLPRNDGVGARITGQARLTMNGGKIGAAAPTCGNFAFGLLLFRRGQATLKNGAKLENVPGAAANLQDSARVTLTGATITRTYPSGCAPTSAAVGLFESSSVTLIRSKVIGQGGVKTTGLETNGTGLLTLDSTQVIGFTETGVSVRASNSKLVVKRGSLFLGNHIGIDARFATAASLTVSNTVMGENDVGIIAARLRVRTSSFPVNREADVIANGAGVDLGTATSPGGNQFRNPSYNHTGVTFLGAQFPGAVNAGTITAIGNTWNPLTQGADAAGHYTTRKTVDGTSSNASGINFVMPNANTRIQL